MALQSDISVQSIKVQYNSIINPETQIQDNPTTSAIPTKLNVQEGENILNFGIFIMTSLIIIPLILACTCCLWKRCVSDYLNNTSAFPTPPVIQEELDSRVRRRIDSLIQQRRSIVLEERELGEIPREIARESIDHSVSVVNLSEEAHSSQSLLHRLSLQSISAAIAENEKLQETFLSSSPQLPYQSQLVSSLSVISDSEDQNQPNLCRCKYDSPYCEQLQAVLVHQSMHDINRH